jgi:hypothetical protein
MKVGIMQPYFFPYIGYYQLIHEVDIFVIYDDVNFIKQGWISRNRILLNQAPHFLTLELKGASSFKKINEIETGNNKLKILKTLELNYKKAPCFADTYAVMQEILSSEEVNLARFLAQSLIKINQFLGIQTRVLVSSDLEKDNELKGADKVLHICKTLQANQYINAIGGQELYSKEVFAGQGLDLHFLKTNPITYSQWNGEFVPWLSIIDVMMFNTPETIRTMLSNYELV